MELLVILAIPMALVALGVGVALVVRTAGRSVPGPATSPSAEAARRHGIAVNALAWIAVVVAVPPVLGAFGLVAFRIGAASGWYAGVVAGLYLAAHGLVFLGVHALGERTWPRPAGPVHRAALTPREPAAPTWLHRLTWGWGAALLVALVAMGVAPGNGQTVRHLVDGTRLETGGPFPGWTYGVPVLLAAAAVLAASEGVLLLIARRPAVVDADPTFDAASRRLSGHRALRGVELFLAVALAAVLSFGGSALSEVGLTGLGGVLVGLGVLAGVTGIAVALVPAAPAVPSQVRVGPAAEPLVPAEPRPQVAYPSSDGPATTP